jgi:hypothetical protein
MNKEEINIHYGTEVWKSHIEYYNEHMFMRGFPYYQITEVNDVYYLWELDLNDPDSYNYRIMQQSDDFSPLYDKGGELEDALGEKYRAMNLYSLQGKELLEKLNSAQ